MKEPLTYDEKLELKYLLFRFYINNVGNNEITFASNIIMESINRELIAEANNRLNYNEHDNKLKKLSAEK